MLYVFCISEIQVLHAFNACAVVLFASKSYCKSVMLCACNCAVMYLYQFSSVKRRVLTQFAFWILAHFVGRVGFATSGDLIEQGDFKNAPNGQKKIP